MPGFPCDSRLSGKLQIQTADRGGRSSLGTEGRLVQDLITAEKQENPYWQKGFENAAGNTEKIEYTGIYFGGLV